MFFFDIDLHFHLTQECSAYPSVCIIILFVITFVQICVYIYHYMLIIVLYYGRAVCAYNTKGRQLSVCWLLYWPCRAVCAYNTRGRWLSVCWLLYLTLQGGVSIEGVDYLSVDYCIWPCRTVCAYHTRGRWLSVCWLLYLTLQGGVWHARDVTDYKSARQ